MSIIQVTALPDDQSAAEHIQAALSSLPYPVTLIPSNVDAARESVQRAGVLLVIVGGGWINTIQTSDAVLAAVETGIHRSDTLVIPVLVDDSSLPSASELPPSLRALAYMTAAPARSGDTFSLDIRRLQQQILSHLRAAGLSTQAAPTAAPVQPPARGSGVPCNVLLIGLILVIGLVLLFLARLRPVDTTPDSVAEVTEIPADGTAPDELLIGLAAGLGEQTASRGEAMFNGVQLALAQRPSVTFDNATFPVDLLVQDTRCSSLGGLQVAEIFASASGLVGVIGDMCDISCRAGVPVYDEAGLTTVSPGCTAPGLTLDSSSSFNRIVPSQAYAAVQAADYVLNTLNLRRVAVIHDEQIVGRQLAETFAAQLTEDGGKLSGYYSVESLTLSIPALLEQVLPEEPELIYYAGRASNAAQLKLALADQGLTALPLFLGDSAGTAEYAALVEEAGANSYAVILLPPDFESIDTLAAQYEATYDVSPPDLIFAYTYDATMLLLDSIEAVGTVNAEGLPVVDRVLLQDYVRTYSGEGITGELRCVGTGDCATAESTLLVWQDGEFRPSSP